MVDRLWQFLDDEKNLKNKRVRRVQQLVTKRREDQLSKAERLYEQRQQILNVTDPYKYNKLAFSIVNDTLSGNMISKTYTVLDELIKDTFTARDWLKSYNDFVEQAQVLGIEDLIEELDVLGQSILGLAVELTPYKTGKLRRSAELKNFGNIITISFNCEYASYVHENLSAFHKIGQAKFLEQAAQQFFPDRTVWSEVHGFGGVMLTISINPDYVIYKHFN